MRLEVGVFERVGAAILNGHCPVCSRAMDDNGCRTVRVRHVRDPRRVGRVLFDFLGEPAGYAIGRVLTVHCYGPSRVHAARAEWAGRNPCAARWGELRVALRELLFCDPRRGTLLVELAKAEIEMRHEQGR